MSFKDLALPLVARGLYVFPVSSDGQKIPLIKDWPNMASNLKQKILYWDAAHNHDVNVGVVARGIVILDDDRGDLKERIENEASHRFPPTYEVMTSIKKATGLRGKHYYFKETAESLLLGFRKKAGVYDFQAEHHMVVGAGSRHSSGLIYEEFDPMRNILPCPPWLVDYVLRTADKPKTNRGKTGHGDRRVHEDFDFTDWCNHYEPIFRIAGDENNYYWPDPCVWNDHRHEHSPKTGFYWDGENLGWSDFATGCEGNGKRIGETLRHMNARMVELGFEPYPDLIWPEEPLDELLPTFGVEEDILPPEYRFKLIYNTAKHGRIYSNDGNTWYSGNGNRVGS
jgi:hypothetical protein